MTGREPIMQALFALLTAGSTFATSGRRLQPWTQVNAQPALFLRHVVDHYPRRATGIPAKAEIECEVWLYSNAGTDPDTVPEVAVNALLDAVELALKPDPFPRQTLGGLVEHCWIEGRIEIHNGDLDGQAIAIVPLRILCPIIV